MIREQEKQGMDGNIWLEKYKSHPTSEEFLDKFGGHFIINIENDMLFYFSNGKDYSTPNNEAQFFDLILRSVREGINFFLDMPPHS